MNGIIVKIGLLLLLVVVIGSWIWNCFVEVVVDGNL